jgi:hypothetical protein
MNFESYPPMYVAYVDQEMMHQVYREYREIEHYYIPFYLLRSSDVVMDIVLEVMPIC